MWCTLVINHLLKHIAPFSHTHTHAPFSYLSTLSLPSFNPVLAHYPGISPAPAPLWPQQRRRRGGGPLSPTKAWMAQGNAHSPGEQEIFVPGGEGWRQRGGERGRERERDRNTAQPYILFITLCNMHQKNGYPKQSGHDSGGRSCCEIFSSWIRGQTNSLSEFSSNRAAHKGTEQRQSRGHGQICLIVIKYWLFCWRTQRAFFFHGRWFLCLPHA